MRSQLVNRPAKTKKCHQHKPTSNLNLTRSSILSPELPQSRISVLRRHLREGSVEPFKEVSDLHLKSHHLHTFSTQIISEEKNAIETTPSNGKRICVFESLDTALASVKSLDKSNRTLLVCLSDVYSSTKLDYSKKEAFLLEKLNGLTKTLDMKGSGSKSPQSKSPVRHPKESVESKTSTASSFSLAAGDNGGKSISDIKALFVQTDHDLLEVEKSLACSSNEGKIVADKKGKKSKSTTNSKKKEEGKKSPPKKTTKSPTKRDLPDNKKQAGKVEDAPGHEKVRKSPKNPQKKKDNEISDSKPAGESEKPPSPRKRASPKKKETVSASNDKVEVSDVNNISPKKEESPKKKGRGFTVRKTDETAVDSPEKPVKSPRKKSSPTDKCKEETNDTDSKPSGTKNRKSRSRSVSASPKKQNKNAESKPDVSTGGTARAIDFDVVDIETRILKSAENVLPSDFKYQYSLTKGSPSLDLGGLIGKISNNLKEKPEALSELFGEAHEHESASSPDASIISEENDSDKTLTEFDIKSAKLKENNLKNDSLEKKDTNNEEKTTKIEEKETNSEENNETSKDSKDKQSKTSDVLKKSNTTTDTYKTDAPNDSNMETETSDEKNKETISIFEMYGLKLKKKELHQDSSLVEKNEVAIRERNNRDKLDSKMEVESNEIEDGQNRIHEEDELMIVSESKVEASIVISDDEENVEMETENDTGGNDKLRKFSTITSTLDPKPLDVLSRLERQSSDKRSAFACDELDEYLLTNKENLGPSSEKYMNSNHSKVVFSQEEVKAEVERSEPDIDNVDGKVFLSFASEHALKAHISLEKKVEWLNENQLRKMAHFKQMKERQLDEGTRRVTDVKSLDEQKQSFRGVPNRMIKYQKLLKMELEDLLLGRLTCSPLKTPARPPQKTADITKIKGWKNKFKNLEECQEITGLNISESGKVHWKTEERLLKNIDPEEAKEIGLDLKKKRRKMVTYNRNKKHLDYEYKIDESVVTEKDVYNEEDEMPTPDKIPYQVKYLSQHKYGARKLFVKKMKLDAEDERILKKLGTQKTPKEEEEEEEGTEAGDNSKLRKGKGQLEMSGKLTLAMAINAVKALDNKLIAIAKKMSKDDGGGHAEIKEEPEDEDLNQHVNEIVEVKEGRTRSRTSSRRQSAVEEEVGHGWQGKIPQVKEKKCTEPGCRYGCICHLCKLSDSGEERESEIKPPCDKEYCKLGCICESIDTKKDLQKSHEDHCRKPGCMLECKCPPRQPKPDIPRDHSKRKKRGKQRHKKSSPDKDCFVDGEDFEDEVGGAGPHEATDFENWEPPSKKKKYVRQRYADLPRRETTYRLAKNLDAVSRKAMEVYATSEMFQERGRGGGKGPRRRKSDQSWEDGSQPGPSQESIHSHLLQDHPVLEILDSEDESGGFLSEPVSCSRVLPYKGPYKRAKAASIEPAVIDLDVEEQLKLSGKTRRKNNKRIHIPFTGAQTPSTGSVSEKMGLTNKIQRPMDIQPAKTASPIASATPEPPKVLEDKWKTQMVCLKARKKQEDKSTGQNSEIKLLEIISNCQWEVHRQNMLSKISHAISKDTTLGVTKVDTLEWESFVLTFLPKSDKPAIIPPELKSKLPDCMYSIRIKVVKKTEVDLTNENEPIEIKDDEDEKKKVNIKLQKKLIDKIKFAERLRNLIIAEEQKGVKSSKFSVSREGIERALKKYKTQLWKAYTGTSNLTLDQLKQALQAAKAGANQGQSSPSVPVPSNPNPGAAPAGASNWQPHQGENINVDIKTMNRIVRNQGFTVVYPTGTTANQFVPLSSLSQGIQSQTVTAPVVGQSNSHHGVVITSTESVHVQKFKAVPPQKSASVSLLGNSSGDTSYAHSLSLHGKTPLVANSCDLAKTNTAAPITSAKSANVFTCATGNGVVHNVGNINNIPITEKPIIINISTSSSRIGNGSAHGETVTTTNVIKPVGGALVASNGDPPSTSVTYVPVNPKTGQTFVPGMRNPSSPQEVLLVPFKGGKLAGSGKVVKAPLVFVEEAKQKGLNAGQVQSSMTPGGIVRPMSNPSLVSIQGNIVGTQRIPSPSELNDSLRQALPSEPVNGSSTQLTVPGVVTTQTSFISPNIYPIKMANPAPLQDFSSRFQPIRLVTPSQMPNMLPGIQESTSQSSLKVVTLSGRIISASNSNTAPFTSNSCSIAVVSLPKSVPGQSGVVGCHVAVPRAEVLTSPSKPSRPIVSEQVKEQAQNAEVNNSLRDKTVSVKVVDDASTCNETSQDISDNHILEISFNKENVENNADIENKKEISDSVMNGNTKCEVKYINKDLLKSTEESDQSKQVSETKSEEAEVKPKDAGLRQKEAEIMPVEKEIKPEKAETRPEEETRPEVAELRTDEIGIKPEVAELRSEVAELKTEEVEIRPKHAALRPEEAEIIEFEEVENQFTEEIKKMMANRSEEEVPSQNVEGGKRKRNSPDLLDEIREQDQARKKACTGNYGVAVLIDSEDSDVDIETFETVFSTPLSVASTSAAPYCMGRQVLKQHMIPTDKQSITGTFVKLASERNRRDELRYLIRNLGQVTFKYNKKVKTFKTGVPKHFVLAEAVKLVSALKKKMQGLEECIADGKQYQKSLYEKLEKHISSFVESGIPETIIKNFLKSVSAAALSSRPKKKEKKGKEAHSCSEEQCNCSSSEESDSGLDYQPCTASEILSVHSPITPICKSESGASSVANEGGEDGSSAQTFVRFRLGDTKSTTSRGRVKKAAENKEYRVVTMPPKGVKVYRAGSIEDDAFISDGIYPQGQIINTPGWKDNAFPDGLDAKIKQEQEDMQIHIDSSDEDEIQSTTGDIMIPDELDSEAEIVEPTLEESESPFPVKVEPQMS
ncbi:uncharacterized protein LOC128227352 isoform X2 [Mya arenaria]|uniref:uncharacterized protein LOC128227352 isoform X2 n=1 Tax=Mya arenaria TaxID=6604 RepID=UPI0022DED495|nr:uncharacterized protein LOC128227352 isoform X2 [Mya arenaria]